MSGNDLLLDTNILIYALKGNPGMEIYFEIVPYISAVTEMEILGVKDISFDEISIRETIIDYCRIIPLTNKIIQRVILIKRLNKIHLPDAIIAATAIEEGFTLVTADKAFKKIKDLSLILINI